MESKKSTPWDSSSIDRGVSQVLKHELKTDYAVIGGGFTGLSTAYHLALRTTGKKIVVLEASTLGLGASGRNSGMMGPGLWGQYHKMEAKFGPEMARDMFSHTESALSSAIRFIENENLECDLVKGDQYKVAMTEGQAKSLQAEVSQLQSAGFNVEGLCGDRLGNIVNSSRYLAGLRYRNTATINPLKLVYALKNKLSQMGVDIYENTPVQSYVDHGNSISVKTERADVLCSHLVIATNGFSPSIGVLKNRIFPVATKLMMSSPLKAEQINSLGISNKNAIIDCRNIFNFFRLSKSNQLIFGGGVPFISDKNHQQLVRDNRDCSTSDEENIIHQIYEIFPNLSGLKAEKVWTGTMGFSIDMLPVIGRFNSKRVTMVGAWCGHGLALSVASGKLISQSILEGESCLSGFPWSRNTCPLLPPGKLLKVSVGAYIAYLRTVDYLGMTVQKKRFKDSDRIYFSSK